MTTLHRTETHRVKFDDCQLLTENDRAAYYWQAQYDEYAGMPDWDFAFKLYGRPNRHFDCGDLEMHIESIRQGLIDNLTISENVYQEDFYEAGNLTPKEVRDLARSYRQAGRRKMTVKHCADLLAKFQVIENMTSYQLLQTKHKYFYPVRAYVHSNVSFSLNGAHEYPYNDPWDSGFAGYYICQDDTEWEDDAGARRCAEAEIRTTNAAYAGEVYGVIVYRVAKTRTIGEDSQDVEEEYDYDEEGEAEEVDSCWGYYGWEDVESHVEELKGEYKGKTN